ncbi:glucose-1-phosphate cytidylyltransferase [Gilliamella sp. wkB108]|uniref:glucose-1-phosphate cytidylyltransferase n=1 Tax=Gilliamella sp. wkB108 TaxID=3120256 RepID=UPI00080EBD43|nr:glucose-1-phosphate cytidylyltransferase [Gilliamella apicola]OCG26850.1 glucose-1-phosphate cytidylyltransferase [Gilliamella apicola]
MKVVILAGGLGTRLGEETGIRPKPMVGIGGHPILWHIMKIYSFYGFNDFVILTGYKSEVIKDYFVNYYLNNSDVTVDLSTNNVEVHNNTSEPWKVTMLYTGRNTLTGGRIKKAQKFIGNEPFMLTYGDGVSNVNIPKLIESHKQSGKLATLTAYQPEGRFGSIDISNNGQVNKFQEKPKEGGAWINAGFFVLQPEIFNYISDDDNAIWEQDPLKNLSKDGELNAYKHDGFWHAMDMLKDKIDLNDMWAQNKAPWKIWKD